VCVCVCVWERERARDDIYTNPAKSVNIEFCHHKKCISFHPITNVLGYWCKK